MILHCKTMIQRKLQHQDTKDILESQEFEEIQKSRKTEGRIRPHHFNVSPDCVPHMEKVFSGARQTYGRNPTDDLNDLDVNTAFWNGFMSVTLQSCSSSWARLYGKSAIYQEPTLEVCETTNSNDRG